MKYTVQFECNSFWDTPLFSIWCIEEVTIPDEFSESHDVDCIDPEIENVMEQLLMDWLLEKVEVTYKVLSIKED